MNDSWCLVHGRMFRNECSECVASNRIRELLEQSEARVAQLAQEQATLRRDMCILACAYCDNIIEFESPEARWTAEGRAKAIDHLLACPNRPELALIEKLETAEAALGETRQALQQLTEKYETLLSRVDTTGSADALVPQPPTGDESTPSPVKETEL